MRTELKRNEELVLELHPHWIALLSPALIGLGGALACIAIAIYVGPKGGGYLLIPAMVGVLYFTYKYFCRKVDLWAVTTQRVIDEEGLFSKNSKESPLDKINNVSFSQSIWGRLFRYGDVQIQTASVDGDTTYYFVSNPRLLKDTITRLQEEYKTTQIKMQAQAMAQSMANIPPVVAPIVATPASAQAASEPKADITVELERLYNLMQKGIITEDEFKFRKTKLLNS